MSFGGVAYEVYPGQPLSVCVLDHSANQEDVDPIATSIPTAETQW